MDVVPALHHTVRPDAEAQKKDGANVSAKHRSIADQLKRSSHRGVVHKLAHKVPAEGVGAIRAVRADLVGECSLRRAERRRRALDDNLLQVECTVHEKREAEYQVEPLLVSPKAPDVFNNIVDRVCPVSAPAHVECGGDVNRCAFSAGVCGGQIHSTALSVLARARNVPGSCRH